MEGGLNILHLTLLIHPTPPYSTPPSLLLFGRALAECTHDPVCGAAVRRCRLHDIMLYFGDWRAELRCSECPRCDSEGGGPRLRCCVSAGERSSRGEAPPSLGCAVCSFSDSLSGSTGLLCSNRRNQASPQRHISHLPYIHTFHCQLCVKLHSWMVALPASL